MLLKDFITKEQYQELLTNGSDENRTHDYPIAFLHLRNNRNFGWLLKHIHPELPSLVYCLACTSRNTYETGYVDFDKVLTQYPDTVNFQHFDAIETFEAYELACEMEGYITLDEKHLSEALSYR